MELFGDIKIGDTVWVVTSEWDGKYSQMSTDITEVKIVDIFKVYSEATGEKSTKIEFDIDIMYPEAVCDTLARAKGFAAVTATSNTYERETVSVLFKRELGEKIVSKLDTIDIKDLVKYKNLYKDFLKVAEAEQYEMLGQLLLS